MAKKSKRREKMVRSGKQVSKGKKLRRKETASTSKATPKYPLKEVDYLDKIANREIEEPEQEEELVEGKDSEGEDEDMHEV